MPLLAAAPKSDFLSFGGLTWSHQLLDGTPTYFSHPLAPARIKATFPGRKMKFLIVLREPVDRIVSNWKHVLAHAPVHKAAGQQDHWTIRISERSFESRLESAMRAFSNCVFAVEKMNSASVPPEPHVVWQRCNMRADHHSMVTRSLYDLQLQYWMSYFPQDSFCIITSDILRADTRMALRRAEQFIGVPVQDLREGPSWMEAALENTGSHSNAPRGWEPDPDVLAELKAFVRLHGNKTYARALEAGGFIGC